MTINRLLTRASIAVHLPPLSLALDGRIFTAKFLISSLGGADTNNYYLYSQMAKQLLRFRI